MSETVKAELILDDKDDHLFHYFIAVRLKPNGMSHCPIP